MYNRNLHQQITEKIQSKDIDIANVDKHFFTRFIANATAINALYYEIYASHPEADLYFQHLLSVMTDAYIVRPEKFKERDIQKEKKGNWFLSNEITGMSLYVDRFCGDLQKLQTKIHYFNRLGVNLLHLMPVFDSPENESDGGYAVSDFRKINDRFGTIDDLMTVQQKMLDNDMYLMLDIVLNHTSHLHEWAKKAKAGEKKYQDYFYTYSDRHVPDQYERTLPEVFPESSPGNFTWNEEMKKWVMTVFHHYQWDLNYTNPAVFMEMLDTIFFYANLGVDILRIDAPAFIWKQIGTTCQNLPQAHTLLCLIKQCVQIVAPGMALLGEAIVAPSEIQKYFGTGLYTAKECDFAYNATHMALQWDALATQDTRVMLAAQSEILQKPLGTSWITYTRCHDDIGLGYDDSMIKDAGYEPFEHRRFLKEYFSGVYLGSPAKGALFSVNPKTNDARISGSLASLCGLEKGKEEKDKAAIDHAIRKILLMQSHHFFLGGIPMIFYGDELGYTNDYSYLEDSRKNYDNRWMHRPIIDWEKNKKIDIEDTTEQIIFSNTKKLIAIRKKLSVVADKKNLTWLNTRNKHVAGYLRAWENDRVYCLFNFSGHEQSITWYVFKENGMTPARLYDHWRGETFEVKRNDEYFQLRPYSFFILEPM